MRRALALAAFLATLMATPAAAIDAARATLLTKTSEAFVDLAKGSHKSGTPPRLTDPAARALIDAVFDTRELAAGGARPMAELGHLNAWNLAVLKIGVVYILAGTGATDIAALGNDTAAQQRVEQNTVTFAPEFGRYFDAQLALQGAIVDTVQAFLASASQAELAKPNLRAGVQQIRSGLAQTVGGVLATLETGGLSDAWRRERLPALASIGRKAAAFLLPEDARALAAAARAAAGPMADPAVKAGLVAFADTLAPR